MGVLRRSLGHSCKLLSGFTVGALLLSQISQEATARFFIISDFDNTTVETRRTSGGRGRRYNGSFETPFVWYRITTRPNGFIEAPEGPLTIEVSPADRHRLETQLARGEGHPGQLGQKARLSSGLEIQPGFYMERNPESFQFFLASPEGRNYLLEDFKRALERETKGEFAKGSWQGPFWPYVQQILSSPLTARQFGHTTARGQTYREWREFYQELRRLKLITDLPSLPEVQSQRSLFKNMSRTEFDVLHMGGSISERKAKDLQETALALRRAPVTDEDLRLSLDGKRQEKLHSIVYAEDDQHSIDRTVELVSDVIRRKLVPLKVVIYNAGTEQQIIDSGRPRAFVITESGGFRLATPLELLGEPPHLTAGQKAFIEGCGGALVGTGREGVSE